MVNFRQTGCRFCYLEGDTCCPLTTTLCHSPQMVYSCPFWLPHPSPERGQRSSQNINLNCVTSSGDFPYFRIKTKLPAFPASWRLPFHPVLLALSLSTQMPWPPISWVLSPPRPLPVLVPQPGTPFPFLFALLRPIHPWDLNSTTLPQEETKTSHLRILSYFIQCYELKL